MSDPVCCILAVCCPGGSERQREALATEIERALEETPEGARKYANWLLDTFDLAPRGTLGDFVSAVARLAKANARG